MKKYEYSDAAKSTTGLMMCGICGKHIISGQYRYRDAGEAYVNHHRACSKDDPNWSRIDAGSEAAKAREAEYVADCAAFLAKWGSFPFEDGHP